MPTPTSNQPSTITLTPQEWQRLQQFMSSSVPYETLGPQDKKDQSLQQASRNAAQGNTNNPIKGTVAGGNYQLDNGQGWNWLRTNEPAGFAGDTLYNLYNTVKPASNLINQTVLPAGQTQVNAAKLLSPQLNDLMTQLYAKYGPQLNKIGSDITQQNALAQANTQNAVLQGPGSEYLGTVNAISRLLNPEFYKTLQAGGAQSVNLLNSIDPTGALTGSERNEVGQGLARQNQLAGTLFSPSAINTVSNAMRYGAAGTAKATQAQSNLSQALNSSAAFMNSGGPNATGFNFGNIYGTASGVNAPVNPGAPNFQGIQKFDASQGQDIFNQYLQQLGTNQNQALNMWGQMNMGQEQINANKKDWLDMWQQGSSAAGSTIGSIAKIGAM